MPVNLVLKSLLPWLDRGGKLSWLKLAAFIAATLPGLALAYGYFTDDLGTKPLTTIIHETGLWAVRFLAATLAITPFRRIFNLSRLVILRRQLGLTALAYTLIHVLFYIVDQNFDLVFVVSEILRRFYLGLGFLGLFVFVILGVTSTDGAVRRLGSERWNAYHSLILPALIPILVHFLLQSKLDVSQACLMLGLLLALILYRLAHKRGFALKFWTLLAVAILSGLITMIAEAGWYASGGRISFWRVLNANLDPLSTFRPGWWVFFSALAVAVLALARGLLLAPKKPIRQHAPHRA